MTYIFSEVRSLMQKKAFCTQDRKAFDHLMKESYHADLEKHQGVIVPYLQGFSHLFKYSHGKVGNMAALIESTKYEESTMWTYVAACIEDPFSVEIVVSKPEMLRVVWYTLGSGSIGWAGAEVLREARNLVNVRRLDLYHKGFDASCMESLCSSKYLGNLESLTVSGNAIGNLGLEYLKTSKFFSTLEVLDISSCDIGSQGLSTLSESPLVSLKSLTLKINEVRDVDLLRLMEGPLSQTLEELDVSYTNIHDSVIPELINLLQKSSIKTLHLGGNGLNLNLLIEVQAQVPSVKIVCYQSDGVYFWDHLNLQSDPRLQRNS